MVERKHETFEEAIRPVPRATPEARAVAVARAPASRQWLLPVAGLVLVALLIVVFFVLPDATRSPAETAGVVPEEPAAEPTGPVLSPEERAALDAQAQRDLAALVSQQDRLENRNVAEWGGDAWTRYQELSRGGDDAYLRDDIAAAAEAYRQALEVGRSLLDEGFRLMGEAIEAGEAALEAGDARMAAERFQFALAIASNDDRARIGLQRAGKLPQVLELVEQGDAAVESGELPTAIERYRAALAIDADWRPAREALAKASGNLAQYRFDRTLSDGFAALGASEFDDAIAHFTQALAMRPGSEQAQEGLFQAEEGLRLGQLALARVRALAFERRELWSQAIEQYESALATDPTLEYAISGLERARARRDLEVKLLNLLDNPRLLFDDRVLADAQRLRAEAEAIDPKGAQLTDQLARMDRLLTAATTPRNVVLRSDMLTQVTLYRVGTIGAFTETEVALRPGQYTAIGSRNGYRDVRRNFTVLPDQPLEPIEVICVEPI